MSDPNVPDCNCGWGGVHDPDNPRCDAHRPTPDRCPTCPTPDDTAALVARRVAQMRHIATLCATDPNTTEDDAAQWRADADLLEALMAEIEDWKQGSNAEAWAGDLARRELAMMTAERDAMDEAMTRMDESWEATCDRIQRERDALKAEQDVLLGERDRFRDAFLREVLDKATLLAGIRQLIPWAESYKMHHVVVALRALLPEEE